MSCVSPIAEAVFVAQTITSGNVLYRAVDFLYTHSWHIGHTSLPAKIDRYVEEGPAGRSLNPLMSPDPCCTFGVIKRSHLVFRVATNFFFLVLMF